MQKTFEIKAKVESKGKFDILDFFTFKPINAGDFSEKEKQKMADDVAKKFANESKATSYKVKSFRFDKSNIIVTLEIIT